jgi:hypothetical protein
VISTAPSAWETSTALCKSDRVIDPTSKEGKARSIRWAVVAARRTDEARRLVGSLTLLFIKFPQ